MDKLELGPGVITGRALTELLAYCKRACCALPAVNVIGSHSVNAVLAAARQASCPVIVQFSHTGAQFYAGKTLDNSAHKASIAGAIAGAHHVHLLAQAYGVAVVLHTDHCAKKLLPWVDGMVVAGERYHAQHGVPLFSSHMLDLSEEPLAQNLELSASYLRRLARIDMALEIELGVTGGEEDGVDNSGIENAKLYSQPGDVLAAYDALSPLGTFTVAASFGNTHGVYAPGNVKLTPAILSNSQAHIRRERGTGEKPVHFVFHGGSGSTAAEIAEAVSYGVVKMNVDTDMQWAFLQPIKHYMDTKDPYLHGQLGNPEGPDKPNKKYIDPRNWLHVGEQGLTARVLKACQELGAFEQFTFRPAH